MPVRVVAAVVFRWENPNAEHAERRAGNGFSLSALNF